MTYQDLLKLRDDHLKAQDDLTLYPYQRIISNQIIYALLHNLRITKDSSPEEIEKLKQYEIALELSRQAGKTYSVGHTVGFILTYLPYLFNRKISVGIFAAQIDQARISYKILRNVLRKAKSIMIISEEEEQTIKEEENARQLVLPDGSSCFVAPISKNSKIEGPQLDLIIVDEAQLAEDQIVKHSIWPMGKSTNAPRVYIGKAGTQICHFYRLGQNQESLKFYFPEVVAMRRKAYEETGDARHLIYEQSVKSDIQKYGEESDEIQREYFGKWQIGTGQFTTTEELIKLESERHYTQAEKQADCYVGIDTAKHPDSTVVTVIRAVGGGKKELLNWLELRGENYQDQYDIIIDFLKRYRIQGIAIDSTGQGDFMPDMFEAHSEWQDENSGLYRVKFSATSKDQMYKNLKVTIKESLTTLPKLDTKSGEKFKQQMLDLQQEYKGQLLSVKHPDDPNAHDDYPDSWALAEWAYAQAVQSGVTIAVADLSAPERKVRKDGNLVTDYWPGLEV